MRMIKDVSNDIRTNIFEAREKIMTAYELKDSCPNAAAWYKEMATAHIAFNTNGHNVVAKLIADYKASEDYKLHKEYADGMADAWAGIHADLQKQTAEVQAMIQNFK